MTQIFNTAPAIHSPRILGVDLLSIDVHRDSRGDLGAMEAGQLGFDFRRVFYIRVKSRDAVRGEHAASADQAFMVLIGAVTVDVDNGHVRETIRLADSASALRVRAGVWTRLRDFAQGALLIVASSRSYAETEYFDAPHPELLSPKRQ